jgi:hypothetical protein
MRMLIAAMCLLPMSAPLMDMLMYIVPQMDMVRLNFFLKDLDQLLLLQGIRVEIDVRIFL